MIIFEWSHSPSIASNMGQKTVPVFQVSHASYRNIHHVGNPRSIPFGDVSEHTGKKNLWDN